MKTFFRVVLLSALVLLTACAAPTVRLSGDNAGRLQGKGIDFSVVPAGNPASNLDGAMLFGALGQAIKGTSMQKRLQMIDPSIKIAENLKVVAAERFGSKSGTEYKLMLKTTYWWLGSPIGAGSDNIVTAAIIEMELRDPVGRVIASDTFNGYNDVAKTPISPADLEAGRVEKVRAALMDVEEQATSKFVATLTNQN